MDISKAIARIESRPGMYLGSFSITALDHFLAGYRMAELEQGKPYKKEIFPLDFRYMHEFVKIRLDGENRGWSYNILQFCGGDEKKALYMFFDLYREFLQLGMKRYFKATLTEKNIERGKRAECHHMEHGVMVVEPLFKNPVAVYVVELTIPAYILLVETPDYLKMGGEFHELFQDAMEDTWGAESLFGKIDTWEEVVEEELKLDKDVHMW